MTKREKYDLLPALRQTMTLNEIGNLWGVSKVMVGRMCRDIGLSIKHSKWRIRNNYQVNL